jgi:hypothetical protein
MSELFKSKLGWVLAGIYLLTVFSFLMYYYLIDRDGLSGFISMMLSLPWSFLLFFFVIPVVNGGQAPSNYNLSYIVAIVVGGLINAFILYLLGLLVTKTYDYFSSRKSKP